MKFFMTALLTAALLLAPCAAAATPGADDAVTIAAPSAVLMERTTGTIIYEKNAHEKLTPASVTKVMTMLLVVEALEAGTLTLETMVTASARAASMGGSQIWLEEGETMSVHEMLKCVAVSSANDCAVALAEHLAGSEEAFVARMNERAAALGMENTCFTNCTGLLDDPRHLTTAYDIALMSRELMSHDLIREYTTIWMDTVRNGEFGLSNTNRLIYHYEGATGVKTGYTSQAGHCLSASAMRDGVEFIAVVLNAPSSADRFESATALLDHAFANYTLTPLRQSEPLPPVAVDLGCAGSVQPAAEGAQALLTRKGSGELRYETELAERVTAPVTKGDELGKLRLYCGEELLAEVPLVATEDVPRLTTWQIFLDLLHCLGGEKR